MHQPMTAPSRRQLARWLAALGVTLAIAFILPHLTTNLDGSTLGDTDDAVRLLLVRDLLAGHGWFDVTIARINPPYGLEMHWSRLIDGGIAALQRLFALAVPEKAEFLARAVWPMLWIFPAIAAASALASRLGGPLASLPALILCLCSFTLFVQFVPGRIDHHGPQIALMMVGLATLAAIGHRRWAAAVAEVAMALQLAVGLEAILLPTAGAAWFGLRFVREPALAVDLRRFALSLGAGILCLYAVQTPPEHWLRPACDMLGANFAGAIAAGCTVIVVVTSLGDAASAGWRARFAGVLFAALTVAVVFIAMEPACLQGPFAMVDAAVKPIWLDRVQEMESIIDAVRGDFDKALGFLILPLLALAGLAWLIRAPERRRDPVWLLAAAYLILATLMGASAIRLTSYAMWCAVPVLAATIVAVASRDGRVPRIIWIALAAIFLSSNVLMVAAGTITAALGMASAENALGTEACDKQDAYRVLDRAPPGLILSEIDRGPFIVTLTHHSAFTAPYHRIDRSILTALTTLAGTADTARTAILPTAIDYVMVCPRPSHAKAGENPDSFQRQLERGEVPPWLAAVDVPGPFALFRVKR